MAKTLKDFILKGGILGKSFVCVESKKNPRFCGSEFLNKPYKVASLSCYKEAFNLYVNFYNNSNNSQGCLNLAKSLNDPEATPQQIENAKKERKNKLKEMNFMNY